MEAEGRLKAALYGIRSRMHAGQNSRRNWHGLQYNVLQKGFHGTGIVSIRVRMFRRSLKWTFMPFDLMKQSTYYFRDNVKLIADKPDFSPCPELPVFSATGRPF